MPSVTPSQQGSTLAKLLDLARGDSLGLKPLVGIFLEGLPNVGHVPLVFKGRGGRFNAWQNHWLSSSLISKRYLQLVFRGRKVEDRRKEEENNVLDQLILAGRVPCRWK